MLVRDSTSSEVIETGEGYLFPVQRSVHFNDVLAQDSDKVKYNSN